MHTEYRNFGCCGVKEEDFSYIFNYKPMADKNALGTRKYESSGACDFGEDFFFLMFFPLLVYGSYLLQWKPEF